MRWYLHVPPRYLSEVTGSICTVTLLLVYCVFAQPSVTTSGVERAGLIVLLSYITVVLSATVSSVNSWIKRTVWVRLLYFSNTTNNRCS